jgi:hypothetical protein
VAVLVALAIGGATVLAATNRSGQSVTAVRTVTESAISGTASQTFTDVPGMSTTLSVPAVETALLVITFSASLQCLDFSSATDPARCYIRVLVDGNEAAPGQVQFDSANDGSGYEANSFQWVRSGLDSGQHTVRIQHKVDDLESNMLMTAKTLTVLRSRQ